MVVCRLFWGGAAICFQEIWIWVPRDGMSLRYIVVSYTNILQKSLRPSLFSQYFHNSFGGRFLDVEIAGRSVWYSNEYSSLRKNWMNLHEYGCLHLNSDSSRPQRMRPEIHSYMHICTCSMAFSVHHKNKMNRPTLSGKLACFILAGHDVFNLAGQDRCEWQECWSNL